MISSPFFCKEHNLFKSILQYVPTLCHTANLEWWTPEQYCLPTWWCPTQQGKWTSYLATTGVVKSTNTVTSNSIDDTFNKISMTVHIKSRAHDQQLHPTCNLRANISATFATLTPGMLANTWHLYLTMTSASFDNMDMWRTRPVPIFCNVFYQWMCCFLSAIYI